MSTLIISIPLHGHEQEFMDCIPLFSISADGPTLGITLDGRYAVWRDRVVVHNDDRSLVFFLPLFDMSFGEVRSQLTSLLQGKVSNPHDAANAFPFEDLVVCGLEDNSADSYSGVRNWIEEMPITREFAERVSRVAKERRLTGIPGKIHSFLRDPK